MFVFLKQIFFFKSKGQSFPCVIICNNNPVPSVQYALSRFDAHNRAIWHHIRHKCCSSPPPLQLPPTVYPCPPVLLHHPTPVHNCDSHHQSFSKWISLASHSSTLAWKIPWMEEPGRLQSTGLQRVGHDWATSHTVIWLRLISIQLAQDWRGQWHPTPLLLPGECHGWRSLVGCSPWGR